MPRLGSRVRVSSPAQYPDLIVRSGFFLYSVSIRPGGGTGRHAGLISSLKFFLDIVAMNWRIKDRISDSDFVGVCKESKSMAEAAATLGLHFNSFKKRALEFSCYQTNQSGIGFPKSVKEKVPLQEILQGLHPYFQTYKLKIRLLKSEVLANQCSICSVSDWNGKSLNLELDHIDGNRQNHILSNLRLLCPNCHSQTDTYRAKNKSRKI